MFTGIRLLGVLFFVCGIVLGFGNIIHRRRNPEAKRSPWIIGLAFVLEIVGFTLMLDGCGAAFFNVKNPVL
ncbi:hypothetical protein WJU16_00870 [Chitinophaga pollutisoli]|uniref:Uncharacterized protein n=1 Tax=Chitinophaga pollutisoli TaxID=3133966 RepID=A0ABZ2YPB1_9BACT